MEFNSREDLIAYMADKIKNILDDNRIDLNKKGPVRTGDERSSMKKAIGTVGDLIAENMRAMMRFDVNPADILKPLAMDLMPSDDDSDAGGREEGVKTNKVFLEDVFIIERRNLKTKREGILADDLNEPRVIIPLCANVLMAIYKKSFKDSKEIITTPTERHAVVNKTHQLVTTVNYDDENLYIDQFHLFVAGDTSKANHQAKDHLREDMRRAKVVIQFNPVSEINRIVVAMMTGGGFIGALYKFNDDLEIEDTPSMDEVFSTASELKEYVQSLLENLGKSTSVPKGYMHGRSSN